MRLLHTSDWHLGRTLHGADLSEAQAAAIDHLIDVVARDEVDVVLLAGDVFDRAIAPLAAVELWDHAVQGITAAGAEMVVSSGNHDSAVRLAAHGGLLARTGLHVRSDPAQVADPVVLRDEHGPVALFALPFLEPALTAGLLARLGCADEPAVHQVDRDQAGVVGRACQLAVARARQDGFTRTVLLAHTWAGGLSRADLSDSERDIGAIDSGVGSGGIDAAAPTTVGSLDRVPVDVLDPFSYVALGHLHGRRTLRDHIRYSGSPVAFSFSERDHRKGSWLVDLDATGLAGVSWVDAPVHRPLSQLRGPLDDLLADPALALAEQHWVKAVLTDPVRPGDAMSRLQSRYPYALTMEHLPEGAATDRGLAYADRIRAASDPLQVALGFVEHVRGVPADAAERAVLAAAVREATTARDDEPRRDAAASVGVG